VEGRHLAKVIARTKNASEITIEASSLGKTENLRIDLGLSA